MTPLRSALALALATFAIATAAALAAPVSPPTLDAARALYDARKDVEAQHAFEAIVAADPANPVAPRFLGYLALRRDDADAAVTWCQKAVALAPDQAEAHRALGDAYGRQTQKAGVLSRFGLAKKCLASFQRAAALEPDNPQHHQSLFDYYRRAPGIAGGGADKAAAEAAVLKRLDPARGALAFASLYQSEKKYAEALAEYDAYLASKPDDFYINYLVGKLADTTGVGRERGLAALRHCLELPPLVPPDAPKHAHAHWRIGNLLKAQGDLAGARAAYEAALQSDAGFKNAAEALKSLPPVAGQTAGASQQKSET